MARGSKSGLRKQRLRFHKSMPPVEVKRPKASAPNFSKTPEPLTIVEKVEIGGTVLSEEIAFFVPYNADQKMYPCFGCNKAIQYDEIRMNYIHRCDKCGIPVCNSDCAERPAHKFYECDIIANELKMRENRTDINKIIADVTVMRFMRNVHCEYKAYQAVFFALEDSDRVAKYREGQEFEGISDSPRKYLKWAIRQVKDVALVLKIYSIIRPNIHSFTFQASDTSFVKQISVFSLILANVKHEKDGCLEMDLLPEDFGNEFKEPFALKLVLKSKEEMSKGDRGTLEICKCLSCCEIHLRFTRILRFPKSKWELTNKALNGEGFVVENTSFPAIAKADMDLESLKAWEEDPFRFINLPLEETVLINRRKPNKEKMEKEIRFLAETIVKRENLNSEDEWLDKLVKLRKIAKQLENKPGPMERDLAAEIADILKLEPIINEMRDVAVEAGKTLGEFVAEPIKKVKLSNMMQRATGRADHAINRVELMMRAKGENLEDLKVKTEVKPRTYLPPSGRKVRSIEESEVKEPKQPEFYLSNEESVKKRVKKED